MNAPTRTLQWTQTAADRLRELEARVVATDRENEALRAAVARHEALFMECSPMKAILVAVCEYYGTPLGDLVSRRKTLDLVEQRQVAMYLARKMTPLSSTMVGRLIGKRDHTTVLHGAAKIARRLDDDDPELETDIACIREIVAKRKLPSFTKL